MYAISGQSPIAVSASEASRLPAHALPRGGCTVGGSTTNWVPQKNLPVGGNSRWGVICHTKMLKKVIEYIQGLTIQQGRKAGQPFKLHAWQKKFLKGFIGADGDAAFSCPRGIGKTTFSAAILCAYFEGPLSQPNSEIILVAPSHGQAGVAFNHAINFMGRERFLDRSRFRFQSTHTDHYVKDLETGVSIRSAGADSKKLHGAAPVLTVFDELAQFPEARIRPMLAAMTTAAGKIPNARMIWIGTRPDSPDHPFQQALDGRNKSVTYRQTHAAKESDPPFQKRTWVKANPGLKNLPDLEAAIRREAAAAKDNDELLPQFKALRLNLGVSDTAGRLDGLLTPDLLEATIQPDMGISGDYVLSLDVGGGYAQTAAAAVSLERPHAVSVMAAWPGIPSLEKRAKGDALARYLRMELAGELLMQEGRVVDLDEFLMVCFERWGIPYQIVADRYRQPELLDALERHGFGEHSVTWRGMGFKDGAEDVRRFQKVIVGSWAAFNDSLLLRAAFASARLIRDTAGNQKIAKQTERGGPGKDDAAVAVVLGLAEADRILESEASKPTQAPVMVFDASGVY